MKRIYAIAVVLLIILAGMQSGCSRRRSADKEKIQSTTDGVPHLELQSLPKNVEVNRPPVASKGECAPRFKNGLIGSCINDEPCRGFGVLNDQHQAECSCYGLVGGCKEGQRCDAMRKSCVPEEELPFERASTH